MRVGHAVEISVWPIESQGRCKFHFEDLMSITSRSVTRSPVQLEWGIKRVIEWGVPIWATNHNGEKYNFKIT